MDAFWRDSIGGIAAAAARTAEELQPHINNHLDKARESLEGVAAAASKTAEELRPHIDEHMQQAGKTLEGMAAAASKTAEELRPHIDEHMQQAGKTLEDIATAAAKTFEDAKPHVKHHLEQFEGSLKGTTAACIESLEMTKIACEAHIKNMPTKEEFVSSAKLGGDRFIEEVHKIRIEWTKLPEAAKQNVVKSLPTEDQFRKAFEDAKHKFSNLVQGFRNVEWEKLPEAAKEHIKKNPRMTGAVQIALLLVTLCPGLVMGPALLLLGFGRLGPVAGKYPIF
jgi:ElaB/YqjD/DUF883 family membrane-anchored ribosome-binding protein